MSIQTSHPPSTPIVAERARSAVGLPKKTPLRLAGAALIWLLATPNASAHVTVQPREAPPNSSQTFSVRVPTEKEEATVHVRVEFPEGLTVSRFEPVPGWTRQIERDAQQRITAVAWAGGQIGPGEFQDFRFQGRTPPEGGQVAFRAYQTYAGGEKVEWTGPEGSDRPAAVVRVGSPSTVTGDRPPAVSGEVALPETKASADGSDLALFVALGAGVVAFLALILGIVSLVQRSPRTTTQGDGQV